MKIVQQRTRTSRRRRGGGIVVEMAFILPMFLSFLFGIVEYGRLVMMLQLITNAAREGARVAAFSVGTNITTAQIQTIVQNSMAGFSIQNQTISVYKYNPSNPADQTQSWTTAQAFTDEVAVQVSGTFTSMLPLYEINPLSIVLPQSVPIQITSIMEAESG